MSTQKIVGGSGMSSQFDIMLSKLKSGEIKGESEFKFRSEKAQTKSFTKRYEKLKRELRKRSKLLMPLEIAIPFNPFTAKADDTFNRDNKWRPLLSATTTAILLKKMASENEELKNELMLRANVEEWDLSEPEVLTDGDKKIFRLYRVPRIMSIPVVTITDERITGNTFANDYMIRVNRNPDTDEIVGEYPIPLQANKFLRDIAFEEINNIDDCIQKAKEGKSYDLRTKVKDFLIGDLATMKEKEVKEGKKKVYQNVFISDDRPSNYMVVYEMELNTDLSVKDPELYKTITGEELDKLGRLVRMTKEMTESIENFRNGTWNSNDVHFDFWELDMVCPLTVDDPNSAMEIGKATRYNSAQNKLETLDFYENLTTQLRVALDDSQDLEKRFIRSARVKKYDESIGNKILDVISRTIKFDHPFLTQNVIKSNANFITLAYADEGHELLAEIEVGISSAPEGNLDEKASAALSKESVEEILGVADSADSSDVEDAEAEVISLD